MVDKKISRKVSTKCRRNYIFAVGSSDVQGSDNIHTAFGTYLVKKLQSLGYVVVTVDEYFTSQKCPRCYSQSEAVCMRVKYCRTCHQYFHRDVMAGENMINIVRGLAVDGIRPEYMCRKPPDNPEIGDSNDSGDETIHAQTETDQSNRASSYRILTRSQKRLDKSAQKIMAFKGLIW
ncbi:hypothetical protein MP638_006717 [Amoeboaphelidium occidentale]|nr:hypothetical protein MP638_006717 [Amoeboaphelidium occidentale]